LLQAFLSSFIWRLEITQDAIYLWYTGRGLHLGPRSRCKRNGISNICGPNYPEFLKFVGTIVTDLNSICDCTLTMPFKSKIERLFFQGVTFYQTKKNPEYKTHYQQIDDNEFSTLTALFHLKIDLQILALCPVTHYLLSVHFTSEMTKL
jgi:hypothetical protein